MTTLDELNRLIAGITTELDDLEHRRSELLARLADLKQEKTDLLQPGEILSRGDTQPSVTNQSPQEDKIALFRSLFRGREDVYPRRFESLRTGKKGYQPVCRNEWISGICGKPKIRCEDCEQRELLPVTNFVIRNHLQGFDPQDRSGRDFTIGVYPMLQVETCWFLAVDFDKTSWQDDVRAFQATCSGLYIPAALERSRSGNGGHVWIFFAEPVPATLARQMGAYILSQTMEHRPEIGLDSYDRFFPSQDTLPRGGFGNLIALPLQKKPREDGNSVFVNDQVIPYPDQWAFLASLHRVSLSEVDAVLRRVVKQEEVLGIRLPVTDEDDDQPWSMPPSRKRTKQSITGPLPEQLDLVLSNQIYIPKAALSPSLRNRLIRLAAFQNPEFYQAQGMRLSTFGRPRIISCCEDFPKHLGLPRGCQDELLALLESLNIRINLADERSAGSRLDVQFHSSLRDEQQLAADALVKHETGILAASTAFGKTVVAAYLIAQRQVNTLVIVHCRQLLDQWIQALSQFLKISPKEVGQIGGGKHKPNGQLDVAMIQSLYQHGVVSDIVGNYGKVVVRPTDFRLPSHLQNAADQSIQEIYTLLVKDDIRNRMIVKDVVAAVSAHRFPVLLTERRDHLDVLAALLAEKVTHVFVMKGGMGKKQRRHLIDQIAGVPADQSRVILATGRYLGEGFDDERLDTLFLALPISWRGTLTQYAGRLHRLNTAKKDVIIYDYVDFAVPVLAKMHARRKTGYKALGYEIELQDNNKPVQSALVNL